MADIELLRTPLYDWHRTHGGRLVEFGGWSMPVQYTTIVEEHVAVRNSVGLFDISHMGRLIFGGPDAAAWIDRVTTNAVGRLEPGKIQYSLMANEDGGLLDDVLVYQLWGGQPAPGSLAGEYLVVCNASNRAAVVARFEEARDSFDASMTDLTAETAMIAVQGPQAAPTVSDVCIDVDLLGLPYYHAAESRNVSGISGCQALVSRTGYTGEDGFELTVPSAAALEVWEALRNSGEEFGIRPCGLAARDTLRFEAGMPLFGHEMSAEIDPYEAGLGWAVRLNKGEFIGREALRRRKAAPARRRVGLELAGKRIARQGYPVTSGGTPVGVVTSGTFAPTLGKSLAMALVASESAAEGNRLEVNLRGQVEPAVVVPLPFYRRDRHLSETLPS